MERTWSYCLGVHVVSTHSRAPAAPGIGPSVVGSLPESCTLFPGSLLPAVCWVRSVGTESPPAPRDPLQRGSHLARTPGLREL